MVILKPIIISWLTTIARCSKTFFGSFARTLVLYYLTLNHQGEDSIPSWPTKLNAGIQVSLRPCIPAYSYINTLNGVTGEQLLKRPKFTARYGPRYSHHIGVSHLGIAP